MFMYSTFDIDISKWYVCNVKQHNMTFNNCPIENKPEMQPKFNI